MIISTENAAYYRVGGVNQLTDIIFPIFDRFHLNGTKYLDYLAFKQAVFIYKDNTVLPEQKLESINSLKNSMNLKRIIFKYPSDHSICVTPYWLLGLIEGEGSFSITKRPHVGLSFRLTLTESQAPLIHAIKKYIDNLGTSHLDTNLIPQINELISDRSHIFYEESRDNSKPKVILYSQEINYLVDVFIPFLYNLAFVTKKYEDFKDFALVGQFISEGKHTTELGLKLISMIRADMNNYRLSTNTVACSSKEASNPTKLDLINKVLNMEPLYIKNKQGLRIIASNFALVPGQKFYIEATNIMVVLIFFEVH